ncbi:hypothetical protein Oweho_2413 [Owenweeksia hongkongensis DSM 17368]|uniref:Regulator of chromosome condensation (RCC1) repeat protein n=1 Tax=Owenweeksia hongkongensis (strain DSM 17368 / CIP 108786 / JCM 12287 / NRRL B-23963 / UST20020801) TaxID=926562 RepID=G8R718_OWEHD|nr:hypothetical protein [Owenweeksia hongkongensis]AEV33383.1 hypothetical protein Oweho_2413 [Owenweeksia hongkongensis DSM 17368]
MKKLVIILSIMSQVSIGQDITTVIGWGDNTNGQISVPTSLENVKEVACGGSFSLALLQNGGVIGWGSNASGQIASLNRFYNIDKIAAGFNHSLLLTKSGDLYELGGFGLRDGVIRPDDLNDAVDISAGYGFSLALLKNGEVKGWGLDNFGQASVPKGLGGVVEISAGYNVAAALKQNGEVETWGKISPDWVRSIPEECFPIKKIYAGMECLTILGTNGMLYSNCSEPQSYPLSNRENSIVKIFSSKGGHGFMQRKDGEIVGWGSNEYGQLDLPERGKSAVSIATGSWHSLAIIKLSQDEAFEYYLQLAMEGNQEYWDRILTMYNPKSPTQREYSELLANIRLLRIRSYTILKEQYFDVLNKFWGGQGTFPISEKRVYPCEKNGASLTAIANIVYTAEKKLEPDAVVVAFLKFEQDWAIEMYKQQQQLNKAMREVIFNWAFRPSWMYPNVDANGNIDMSANEIERMLDNNEEVSQKTYEVISGAGEIIATLKDSEELWQTYKSVKGRFLKYLERSSYTLKEAGVLKAQLGLYCDPEEMVRVYDMWFEKEYLNNRTLVRYYPSLLSKYQSEGRNIDAIKLLLDSKTATEEEITNMLVASVNAGRVYAVHLLLSRGANPDLKGKKGISAREELQRDPMGPIQNEIRALFKQYEPYARRGIY